MIFREVIGLIGDNGYLQEVYEMETMKERSIGYRSVATLLLVFAAAVVPVFGEYEIVWYTIDGGGGVSSGGGYSLSGTIGQADADWSRGEEYEMLGGFWAGGPLCVVEFDDFARFAALWWLRETPALEADLNYDSEVDFEDLTSFSDYWLGYCPYRWPLR